MLVCSAIVQHCIPEPVPAKTLGSLSVKCE